MRLREKRIPGLILALLLAVGGVGAQDSQPSEYQLKAAFLFNFAKFVEWPSASFPEPDSPFLIAILGDNPFEAVLENAVKGKSINRHPFVVKLLKTLPDAQQCHILFISKSD